MARPLRIAYPGAVYHITSRGNEKKSVYGCDEDRLDFLDILQNVNARYNWICHSYCLMDNHYHLLVETPDANLSIGMRQLNGVYTQAFNKRHNRSGHLFQGRYKAILIQKESHLLEDCRYIVLNPVRAGMSQKPGDWIWSSYGGISGLRKTHPCLTADWILGQCGRDRRTAEKEYRKFVQRGIGAATIWKQLRGQIILGEEAFADPIIDHLRQNREIPEISRCQRYMDRPALADIFTSDIVRDRNARDRKIVEAVEKHGYRQREVADCLGLYFTSVSRIMRQYDAMARK